jgi:hypothetical protein
LSRVVLMPTLVALSGVFNAGFGFGAATIAESRRRARQTRRAARSNTFPPITLRRYHRFHCAEKASCRGGSN